MGWLKDLAKGAVSTLTGGLIDLGGKYAQDQLIGRPAAAEAYAQSEAGTAKQYERQVEMYKNRYQWMLEDMKKAGLNPILAAASGMSTSGTPQVSPAQAFQARPPTIQAASAAKEIAEKGLAEQRTAESVEQVLKIRADTGVASQKERNLVQEHVKMQNEVVEIISRYNKNMAEVEKLARVAELTEAQKRHEEELLKNTKYQRSQIINMARKIGYQLAELRRESDLYDSAAGMWLKGFEKILKSAGISIGIVPGIGKRR